MAQLVNRYFICVYVIPDKVEEIVRAVKQIDDLLYGDYKWVHWISDEGTEYYNVTKSAGKDVPEDQVNSNPTVKLEFSIKSDEELLHKLLDKIIEVHPWDEPVIRVSKIKETRVLSKLSKLKPHNNAIIGDPEELVDLKVWEWDEEKNL